MCTTKGRQFVFRFGGVQPVIYDVFCSFSLINTWGRGLCVGALTFSAKQIDICSRMGGARTIHVSADLTTFLWTGC